MKKNKVKFETLSKVIVNENQLLHLNSAGKELLKKYYQLIKDIEVAVGPVVKPYAKEPKRIGKEVAIHVISILNSRESGTDEFQLAARLDIMTSGGKQPVDATKYPLNRKDKITQYIEPIMEGKA